MGKFADFCEVIKGLRHKKMGEVNARFCPKCGSEKILLSCGVDPYPKMYGITPGKYVCIDCNYIGPIVFEQINDKSD